MVRRLLAHQRAVSAADDAATAAGRIYEKLHEHLDPLSALPASERCSRAAPSCRRRIRSPSPDAVASKTRRSCGRVLQALEPVVAAATAAALFGTFFALITTFIGERLTTQALRGAWPTIEETAPTENEK